MSTPGRDNTHTKGGQQHNPQQGTEEQRREQLKTSQLSGGINVKDLQANFQKRINKDLPANILYKGITVKPRINTRTVGSGAGYPDILFN
ncbi:hypothetical protein LXL04_039651 [Taraxacum kok-saghyz]